MPERSATGHLRVFIGCLVGLSVIAIWLVEHHYSNEFSLSRWEKVMEIMAAPEFRIEYLGLVYPHVPVYFLIPFYLLPGVDGSTAPYLISVTVGAGLLALWNHHLTAKGYAPVARLWFCLLIAIHPYFLWGVTTGTHHALSLLMFYLLYLACIKLILRQDVRAFMFLGLVFAVYFFVDERTFFLFLALLPFIPLIAPPRMLTESVFSVYFLTALPLLILVATWVYLNWIFYQDPWVFLYSTESSFRGAWLETPHNEWLKQFGGNAVSSSLMTLGIAVVAYPILLWLGFEARGHRILLRGSLVMLLHPVIAAGIATYAFFLPHPSHILFLFSAATMVTLLLLPRKSAVKQLRIAVLLALSAAGGWWTFFWLPSPDMQQWSAALQGKIEQAPHGQDRALAEWLRDHPAVTLVDDRSAYRVIVYRGDAAGLILPFSSDFKTALRRDNPGIEQILVPNPDRGGPNRDAINRRYPRLYHDGLPGYTRVYDSGDWRVYRQRPLEAG